MNISGNRIETNIEIEIETTCLVPGIKLTCVEGMIRRVLCHYLIVDALSLKCFVDKATFD